MAKVLIINGPNLNMLGQRPKDHYGSLTLSEINASSIIGLSDVPTNALIIKENANHFELDFFQSNSEGEIVTKIQNSLDVAGIIINPAAYTHTSIAIRDALELYRGPIVEVHLSDVDKRDDFRKINFIRDLCTASFSGKKQDSYLDAIKYLKKLK